MGVYIGLDIGGTKFMVHSVSQEGKELKRVRENTPYDLQEGIELLYKMIRDVAQGNIILGIGAAIGGPIDLNRGIVSPLHQESWRDVPLKEMMEREFSAPFYVDVDTNVAAIAEYVLGGYQERHFLYITVSTGMGGGFLIDGKVYEGLSHPEIAHQCIDYACEFPERVECECGGGRCLEAFVSGNGIKRLYQKNAEDLPPEQWSEVAYNLGMGLRNIATILSPSVIVFGGGVSVGGGEAFIKKAEEVMRRGLKLVTPPKLVLSKLGYDTAIYGASYIAKMGDTLYQKGGS